MDYSKEVFLGMLKTIVMGNRAKMINLGKRLILFLALLQFVVFKVPLYAENTLILIISSTKTIYQSGEPILIEQKIINKSENVAAFIYPPLGMNLSYLYERTKKKDQFDEKSTKGQYGKKADYVYFEEPLNDFEAGGVYLDGYVPGDDKIIELKKDEAYSHVFEVSQLIRFDKPGVYKISISYGLNETYGPYGIKELFPLTLRPVVGPKIIHAGILVSNELRLEVVEK